MKILTVGELRKALEGVDDSLPVCRPAFPDKLEEFKSAGLGVRLECEEMEHPGDGVGFLFKDKPVMVIR